jgi:alanyl-tRNA synthetase
VKFFPVLIFVKGRAKLRLEFWIKNIVEGIIELMTADEIRRVFIDYFTKTLKRRNAGHIEVPSSPLVPEQHPTLLFVNSGMVQFTPYFLGEKDPVKDFGSARLCSVQKCVRTGDLGVVGRSRYHNTFFEMMGSWSVGDYGKKEAVEFAYDLLTDKKYGYGLDAGKFIPTVFAGNKECDRDEETIKAWRSVGISDKNISRLPASENWWAPSGFDGPGPCGPCTEVLYDRGPKYGQKEKVPGMTDNPRYLEIWNAGVFMQYNRDASGKLHELEKMSVDTGAGLERFAVLLQGVDSIFETDLFSPITNKIKSMGQADHRSPEVKEALWRSSDHLRAVTFMISESVNPSNKDQGYVLRKLIRTVFYDFVWRLNIDSSEIVDVLPGIVEQYEGVYPEISNVGLIREVIEEEIAKTKKISDKARRFIRRQKGRIVSAFDLRQSVGAPPELSRQIAAELGKRIDETDFDEKLERHKKLSRKKAGKKFKGGLADHSEEVMKLHTATHLLHASLRKILGEHVRQKGSNITGERLRFDFSHSQKLTEKELKKAEDLINEQIKNDLPITFETKTFKEAQEEGALAFFGARYGEKVKVYTIGSFSREVCGGPHVARTSEIGRVRIKRQEKIGTGSVRLYATIDNG